MCPRRQEVQDVAPSCSVIVLSGHLVHPLTAMSRYVPAGHRAELPEKFPITMIYSVVSQDHPLMVQVLRYTLLQSEKLRTRPSKNGTLDVAYDNVQ